MLVVPARHLSLDSSNAAASLTHSYPIGFLGVTHGRNGEHIMAITRVLWHLCQGTSTPTRKRETMAQAPAPKIMILYTGGTIGMIADPKTGALVPFDFDHLMENVPKIGRLGYEISHQQFDPPIDSSNMNPGYWKQLATMIADSYDAYDGFVVLHGTDTMAYTASALSFMLRGLAKPVIITGSQLPIGEVREDGTENLITALQIAAAKKDDGTPMVQEVAISFSKHLWRGNRSTKVSSTDFGAFRSFNYPALADMDLHIDFHEDFLLPHDSGEAFGCDPNMDDAVSVIWVYPGITQSVLRPQLESENVKGFVLRTFGAGNAPTEQWFIDALSDAMKAGKVIVNVTQCPAGGVEEKRYATGDAMAKAGVVSGYDMTCEAALTKMMHLFGAGLSAQDVAKQMQVPLAGELTAK